jgi:hypothetical protein
MVERYGSHARSFSSEKIMQDFQTLQRLGASMMGAPGSCAAAAVAMQVASPDQQHKVESDRDKRSHSEPRRTSLKVRLYKGRGAVIVSCCFLYLYLFASYHGALR